MDVATIIFIGIGLLLVAFAAVAVVSTLVAAHKVEMPERAVDEPEHSLQDRLSALHVEPVLQN